VSKERDGEFSTAYEQLCFGLSKVAWHNQIPEGVARN